MLSVLFVIFLILFVTFMILSFNNDDNYGFIGITTISGVILLFVIGFGLCFINTAIHENIYQQQIEMLEEENKAIDEDVRLIVKDYMNWESDVYDQFKNESAITLVQLFPELKSNGLVQTQIDVLLKNREEIKCLKKKVLESKAAKWWLYFGG